VHHAPGAAGQVHSVSNAAVGMAQYFGVLVFNACFLLFSLLSAFDWLKGPRLLFGYDLCTVRQGKSMASAMLQA
jgi:hypothetical protein